VIPKSPPSLFHTTAGGMKMLPFAGDSLSSYTKVEAGYNP